MVHPPPGTNREFLQGITSSKWTTIDIKRIKDICMTDIPEELLYRPTCWKLVLHYLPPDTSKWTAVLGERRNEYYAMVSEFVVPLYSKAIGPKNKELIAQIRADVCRTSTNYAFACEAVAQPANFVSARLYPRLVSLTGKAESRIPEKTPEYLERILFVIAKVSPYVSFVQGMSQILFVLFFTFSRSQHPNNEHLYAEPDAFFVFINLLVCIKDRFIKSLDSDLNTGFSHELEKLESLLKLHDYELWRNFNDKQLDMCYFTPSWLLTLYSQSFHIPDTMRIWDHLFASGEQLEFFYYFATAILIYKREALMEGTFGENLELLQNLKDENIQEILGIASQLYSDWIRN